MKLSLKWNLFLWCCLVIVGITHLKNHFIDYPVFELAGLKILSGTPQDIYDLQREGPGGFYYSYFFGLFFCVFAALGNPIGRWAYFFLLLWCYRFILKFSVQTALKVNPSDKLSPVFLENLLILVTLYSFNDALMTANIGILLLSLSIAAFKTRESPSLSGFLLAVAIVFKMYPALLLGYFVWSKRWKQVVYCGGWCCLLWIGFPIFFNGFTQGLILIRNQFLVVSHFDQHWTFASHVFQNLPATAIRLGSVLHLEKDLMFWFSLTIGLFALILLFLPSFFLRKSDLPPTLEEKMFVLALAFVPVLTPVSWYNMGLFYSPLLATLLLNVWSRREPLNLSLFAAYLFFYCLFTPDIVGRPLNQKLAWWGFPFFGVLCAIVGFVRSQNILSLKNPYGPRK